MAVFDEYPELADMCPAGNVTQLHQAADHGELLLIQWLLAHGADVNAMSSIAPSHDASILGTPQVRRIPDGHRSTSLPAATVEAGSSTPSSSNALQSFFWRTERTSLRSPPPRLAAGITCRNSRRSNWRVNGILEVAVKGNQPDVVKRLLDLGLDPDERTQIGNLAEQTWTAGGPLFQAVVLNRIELARLLLERGADPNAGVWTAGSPAFRAYDGRNPEMIALIELYGGWIDAGSAGYARQVEIARKMLAGEMDAHIEPNDFSGHTIAEQLLWGGASSLCVDIVRMALEHIDWQPGDPRWFWMLWRPVPGHDDYNEREQAECCECLQIDPRPLWPAPARGGLWTDHAA